MARDGAFSGLKLSEQVGLDQRLFQETKNETTQQQDNTTTEEPALAATLPRDHEPAPKRNNASALQRTTTRANSRSSQRDNSVLELQLRLRQAERHSHDIYHDQVQWMNRLKLDLEEHFAKRVTSNAIVQLAIDSLIADYELSKETSMLVQVLVRGKLPAWLEGLAEEKGGDA